MTRRLKEARARRSGFDALVLPQEAAIVVKAPSLWTEVVWPKLTHVATVVGVWLSLMFTLAVCCGVCLGAFFWVRMLGGMALEKPLTFSMLILVGLAVGACFSERFANGLMTVVSGAAVLGFVISVFAAVGGFLFAIGMIGAFLGQLIVVLAGGEVNP